VRGVCDRASYRDEKRRAFEAVAARLDVILNANPTEVSHRVVRPVNQVSLDFIFQM
jgi:hypothetical protein